MDSRYISITEFRQYAHIGRNKAYALCKQSDFPTIRIGKRILIDKEKLDNEWIPKHRQYR